MTVAIWLLQDAGSETEYSVCVCVESWSPGVFQSNQSNQMTVFESHFGIVFICLYLPLYTINFKYIFGFIFFKFSKVDTCLHIQNFWKDKP